MTVNGGDKIKQEETRPGYNGLRRTFENPRKRFSIFETIVAYSPLTALGLGVYSGKFNWIAISILGAMALAGWLIHDYFGRWDDVKQGGFTFFLRTVIIACAWLIAAIVPFHMLGTFLGPLY